jgi:hypothetical protein
MRAPSALLIFAAFAAGAACRGPDLVLVHVAMPGVSPFPPGSFAEIVVTEFRNEANPSDFEAGWPGTGRPRPAAGLPVSFVLA